MRFNEQQQLFRQSLRDFLASQATPQLDQWEEAGEIPRAIWHQLAEQGYLGLHVPEPLGGSGLDESYLFILGEELSRLNSGGFAAAILAHISLAMLYIQRFGSDDLQQRYLPGGCTGKLIGGLAITEPHAGSDVAAIRTTAVGQREHYLLNGSKTFITNGVLSDYLVVAAKTEPEAGSGGISLLVVDRDSQGLSANKLDKLGWRASDTGELFFDAVKVPKANLLGELNMGFYYIMQNFALERLMLAIGAIASCEQALQVTLQYMRERTAFGRPIDRFQVLRHRVAQLSAEVECNKVFNYSVMQQLLETDFPPAKECAMAKLLSTELADKVMYQCLQCFGGYGFMEDYPLARMFRDARLGTIGGGTSEIMRELIAKMIV